MRVIFQPPDGDSFAWDQWLDHRPGTEVELSADDLPGLTTATVRHYVRVVRRELAARGWEPVDVGYRGAEEAVTTANVDGAVFIQIRLARPQ